MADLGEVLSAQLASRVAEHLLKRRVRVEDASSKVHQCDADGGALEDDAEPLFTFAERGLGLFARGEFAADFLVELGVLDGDAGLARDTAEQGNIFFREAARPAIQDGEHAEDFSPGEDRHAGVRTKAAEGGRGPAEPRVFAEIRNHQRFAGGGDGAGEAFAQPQAAGVR